MNKTKQFWTLFKFQTKLNPFIWFMPLGFSGALWIPLLTGYASERPLSSSIDNYQLFLISYLAVIVLAPDILSFAASQNVWAISGTEFLLTRAIDRRIVYRAKSVFLYLLVLLVPITLLFFSWKDSTLKTREYNKPVQHECITKLPGATLSKDKYGSSDQLTIPNGNALISGWNIWSTLLTAIASQILIWIIYPLKIRKYLFYAILAVVILYPLFSIGHGAAGRLSTNEKLFFLFATHQTLAWISTILLLILSQLWCERRFTQLEQ